MTWKYTIFRSGKTLIWLSGKVSARLECLLFGYIDGNFVIVIQGSGSSRTWFITVVSNRHTLVYVDMGRLAQRQLASLVIPLSYLPTPRTLVALV
jgi:hypothetical protein